MDGKKLLPQTRAQEDSLPLQSSALAIPEKGSIRSMWELVLQLRALLPYLSRLAPLLERGLLKAAPDLSGVQRELHEMQTAGRSVGADLRSQALRLQELEEQGLRLREAAERSAKEIQEVADNLRSFTAWLRALTALVAIVLAAVIAVIVLALLR